MLMFKPKSTTEVQIKWQGLLHVYAVEWATETCNTKIY